MRGGAVPSRYPAVLACRPSVLAQHSAVPLRQPLILTPPFLSPGSLLRSASRSFHGIDPAGSGEVSRALHGINPVATAEAPVAHRRIAPLLPPKSHVSFAGFAPSRRFARCKKQKSRHFCNFFAIADSPPSLKSRIGPQHSWITCIFASQSAIGRFQTIRNRKKVAPHADYLFLSPRGWLQDRSGASREDNDASGGRLGPGGHPRGGPADLRRKMASGGPAKRPLATLQKNKKRGHPTSDALALFSNDIAPT